MLLLTEEFVFNGFLDDNQQDVLSISTVTRTVSTEAQPLPTISAMSTTATTTTIPGIAYYNLHA